MPISFKKGYDLIQLSLWCSTQQLKNITIKVFSTEYALSYESFRKEDVKNPTAIFVSDTLHAENIALKIQT